jgi:DNA polymerase III psi subunit
VDLVEEKWKKKSQPKEAYAVVSPPKIPHKLFSDLLQMLTLVPDTVYYLAVPKIAQIFPINRFR